VVGPNGLLIVIIGYQSFVVLVLVWGWEKKLKNDLGFGKYCVPLPYTHSTCGVALKDDFSYNRRCLSTSNDFTRL
jgi:hypothetical protein